MGDRFVGDTFCCFAPAIIRVVVDLGVMAMKKKRYTQPLIPGTICLDALDDNKYNFGGSTEIGEGDGTLDNNIAQEVLHDSRAFFDAMRSDKEGE